MGQITIYMDDTTLKKIESAARKDHDSVSKWVKKRLMVFLEGGWPKDYFDLFGVIEDKGFKRPVQPKGEQDVKRQEL